MEKNKKKMKVKVKAKIKNSIMVLKDKELAKIFQSVNFMNK